MIMRLGLRLLRDTGYRTRSSLRSCVCLRLPNESRGVKPATHHHSSASTAAAADHGGSEDEHHQRISEHVRAALRTVPRDKPHAGDVAYAADEHGSVVDGLALLSHGDGRRTSRFRSGTELNREKWARLSLDHRRLATESDLATASPSNPKLVDIPAFQSDIGLWACLLEFRRRRYGAVGTGHILRGLHARRALTEVQGQVAHSFWQTLLRDSIRDPCMLELVWDYAQWLSEQHGVRWPNLYEEMVPPLITQHRTGEALRWHTRLMPHFGPTAVQFGELMKRYVTDPRKPVQELLQNMYRTSLHRSLYDTIVPYLFDNGHALLAKNWREVLTSHDDVPRSSASALFLQHIARYYPGTRLGEAEVTISSLDDAILNDAERESRDQEEDNGNIWHFINRIHGYTFGIKEKTYDDGLISRWFASTWISLDLAIEGIRIFGIDRIGALSLQAIALREQQAERICRRMEQLERLQIRISPSNYARAIHLFAVANDDEYLALLLNSDIHPEEFDDVEAQQRILDSALTVGDWKLSRLLLAVRVAVSRDSLARTSSQIIAAALDAGDLARVLRILGEMKTRELHITATSSNLISLYILQNLQETRGGNANVKLYAAICSVSMGMLYPLATQALHRVLMRVGHEGMLLALEVLCAEVIQHFAAAQSAKRTAFYVHHLDVPGPAPDQPPSATFHAVPRDLSFRHEHHPVRLLFNTCVQTAIIRWGFQQTLQYPQKWKKYNRNVRSPRDFGMARGIRLLALVRERGVYVEVLHTRQAIVGELAKLYGIWNVAHQVMRRNNQLSLQQAKDLCDEAWGEAILPPLSELKDEVHFRSLRLNDQRRKSTVRSAQNVGHLRK